ncbi:MAG: NmrA family transcriptional regulator [Chitinophagaceae bacterium]|nr:MAG: NmrA family transcriptional regulator [Chitinophagaceae bacterium]
MGNRILVTGATGKTGSRVTARLQEKGIEVKIGSRKAVPSFDWNDPSGWKAVLARVSKVYIAYQPDLAVPGAVDTMRGFINEAKKSGVAQLVLLSGRGEKEAQEAEELVMQSGLAFTIVRAAWFFQNFSESFFLDNVLAGEAALPLGDVKEPFVDADDIADVVVAALTDDRHHGKVYELSGPDLLSFPEAFEIIAHASGRRIQYLRISNGEYNAAMAQMQVPADYQWLVNYLFTEVLDGRNESLTDGVQQALGRKPKSFKEWAGVTAATGIWAAVAGGEQQ